MVDLMGSITETMHLSQQQASQQVAQPNVQAYIGYIQKYDVQRNQVTVINPLNCGQDGTPAVSAWMPLGTLMATSGGQNAVNQDIKQWGEQYAVMGGASTQDPTAGEQVLVVQIRAGIGYCACAMLTNFDQAKPPGPNIPISGATLKTGELLSVQPSGTTVHNTQDGSVKTYVQQNQNEGGNIETIVQGGVMLETGPANTPPDVPNKGDINLKTLQAPGNINLSSAADINVTTIQDLLATIGRTLTAIVNNNAALTSTTGSIALTAAQNIAETATGDIGMTAGGNMNLRAPTITALAPTAVEVASPVIGLRGANVTAGTAQPFFVVLAPFLLTYYNEHTHGGVTPGAGVSGPPTVAALPVYPFVTDDFAAS